MVNKHTWAAALFTAVIAVTVGVALLLQTRDPSIATHDWEIGLVALASALFLCILVLLVGAFRERPRLYFDDPVVEEVTFKPQISFTPSPFSTTVAGLSTLSTLGAQDASEPEGGSLFKIVYLHIRNEPRSGAVTAQSVHVRMRFRRGEEVIADVPARWSHTDQGVPAEATQVAHQQDLAPNGVRYKLDIIAKFSDNDQCFAITDRVRYTSWRQHPLGAEPMTIELEARGSNARTRARWSLSLSELGEPELHEIKQGWRLRLMRRLSL